MKYFVRNNERRDTAYHEFFKGEWKDDDGFWHDGSVYLYDEFMSESGLGRILFDAVAEYDSYGMTLFFPEDWEEVCRLAEKRGGMAKEIVDEARLWTEDAFETCGCFTILGL